MTEGRVQPSKHTAHRKGLIFLVAVLFGESLKYEMHSVQLLRDAPTLNEGLYHAVGHLWLSAAHSCL
jgi:hypothetical protein